MCVLWTESVCEEVNNLTFHKCPSWWWRWGGQWWRCWYRRRHINSVFVWLCEIFQECVMSPHMGYSTVKSLVVGWMNAWMLVTIIVCNCLFVFIWTDKSNYVAQAWAKTRYYRHQTVGTHSLTFLVEESSRFSHQWLKLDTWSSEDHIWLVSLL